MSEQKKRVRKWTARTAKTQYVSLRMPFDDYDRLQALCQSRDMTLTAAICEAVERYLDSEEELDDFLKGGKAFFI